MVSLTCQFVLRQKGVMFIFHLVGLYPSHPHPQIYTEDTTLLSRVVAIIDSEIKIAFVRDDNITSHQSDDSNMTSSTLSTAETNELKQHIHASEEIYRSKPACRHHSYTICRSLRVQLLQHASEKMPAMPKDN